MAKKTHPLDRIIIQLLQFQGLIKKEAEAQIQSEVYQLNHSEIVQVKQYAQHFGEGAKERLIEELLEQRREALFHKVQNQLNNPLLHMGGATAAQLALG
ncbi:hypothetical protein M1D72_00590 [Vibrio sp. AK197]|uniref:Uncharacterized protein n=1 Tax=Vibrio olivae TaxID=1243002 RepID=A0ABV5HND4_9VIBR